MTSPTSRRTLSDLSARAFWLALVGVHVPAVIGVGRALLDGVGVGEALGAVALSATIVLFVLKAMDVGFLRLGSRRATMVAFLLACTVAHYEVVATDPGREIAGATACVVAAVVLPGAMRQTVRRLRGSFDLLTAFFALQRDQLFMTPERVADRLSPALLSSERHSASSRGPPARI